MKIVISDPKSGKSWQKELEAGREAMFFGRNIGESVDGANFGFDGYKFTITGGSDKDGTPMRKDIHSIDRVQAFLSRGPGYHAKTKGERKRKYLRGKTIGEHIIQVNLKVAEAGATALDQIFPPKEAVKKE